MTLKNLPPLLTPYDKMSDADKTELLVSLYTLDKYSWAEIAHYIGTYPNKVRRDAKRLGIFSRNKSDAQSQALFSGRQKHPTKGVQRADTVKIKISEGMASVWLNLKPEQREQRSQQARDHWNKMSKEEKEAFQHAAAIAIRKASTEGSKLEKFLYSRLTKLGYRVEYHKEHFIVNEKLHIDIWLPERNVAIEIDGPSHFEAVWGAKNFQRTQKTDNEKSGLILRKGAVFIRIKHTKYCSAKYQRDILKLLVDKLADIATNYPEIDKRYITLGE